MHIPDGFLSAPVWAGLSAASAPAVAWAVRRAQASSDERRIPLLGVMGAFVFAAQMINFPVGAGASGHLLGATLLTVTVGPWAAAVVMTAVLAIQALIFQDGGLLALGANVFNMAIAGVAVAAAVRASLNSHPRLALFAAAFASTLVTALLTLGELRLSGVPLPAEALTLALVVFAITAALEGVITVAVLESIAKLNPHWVQRSQPLSLPARAGLLASAALLAVAAFWLASAAPDGLEHLAESAGFAVRETTLFSAPFPDYESAFVSQPWLRRALAGLVGLGVTYALCWIVGRWIARYRSA